MLKLIKLFMRLSLSCKYIDKRTAQNDDYYDTDDFY